MLTWPNWVDLVVVTIVLTTGYKGFHRGLFTGLINLLGVVATTALVVTYANSAANWIMPWLKTDPTLSAFALFWCCFLVGLLVMHQILKVIARILAWERFNPITQILGMLVGALRGGWWAGLLLFALSTSGVEYLQKSVDERSVTAGYVLPPVRSALERLVDLMPAEQHQSSALLPPLVAGR